MVNTESTLPPPPPPVSKGRNPWKIFGIITIVLVLVGGAVAAGFVLGSSNDTSSESTPAESTAPAPPTGAPTTAAPATAAPTTAAPAFDPEIERLLLAAENGIPLIVSDFKWQNPEVYYAYTREVPKAESAAQNQDCSYFSSDAFGRLEVAKVAVDALEAEAVAKVDALAQGPALYRKEEGELGDRAYEIYNILRYEAEIDIGHISQERWAPEGLFYGFSWFQRGCLD